MAVRFLDGVDVSPWSVVAGLAQQLAVAGGLQPPRVANLAEAAHSLRQLLAVQ